MTDKQSDNYQATQTPAYERAATTIEILQRVEPGCWADADGFAASQAISLKRIADSLDDIKARMSPFQPSLTEEQIRNIRWPGDSGSVPR